MTNDSNLHSQNFVGKAKILITGANGSNGVELIKLFSARGIPVRAMVRNLSKADAIRLSNVEVVEGNFDDADSLKAALAGIERAFLLISSSEHAEAQQKAFVEAAKQSEVRHIVKLSQFGVDAHSSNRFLRYHAAVEAAIEASGLAYTFLRPNLFMQGLLNFASTIKAQNAFYAAAGDAKVSIIDVRDIAEVAFAALTESGHEGKAYELTGPQALTHGEMAEQLSKALGRTISFVDIPPEKMREALLGVGFPEWQAEGLIEEYALYREGEAEPVASGVLDAIGKEPRGFAAFARDYVGAFA